MRFIADSMLGRLVRWLRLLGYDTVYYPRIEDSILLRIAREENRILLTRDSRLVKARGLRQFLLLEENDPFDQLRSIIAAFNLKVDDKLKNAETAAASSRCIICNAVLNNVSREDVKNLVPEYVYQTSTIFRQCSGCGKPYWNGTHPERFRKKLAEILYGKK